MIVFNRIGVDEFKGPGYHHPNKLESPQDCDSYSIIVAWPMVCIEMQIKNLNIYT